MTRLLSLLFLFCAASVFGATGDISGAAIEDNGWVLDVWFSGYSTNSAWAFGWGTNNNASTALTLTVGTPGYDDSCVSNWNSINIIGTKQLRLPYPNNALNDVTLDGSNAKARIALSDYIFAGDSVSFSIAANVYSNNALATFTATNNSTQTHPAPVGNWSWPGYNLSSSPMRLRAIAFHRSGQMGRPVRAVKFIVRGAGASATNIVTSMSIDTSLPDQASICEFKSDFDLSAFTQGEALRCDFTAYPWRGTNALSTLDGVNALPPFYAPQTNICNKSGTYGVTYAVVDPVNGGTGSATTNFSLVSPPAAFATINAAAVAIANSNGIWFSRTNISAGVIYLTNGNHKWTGASATIANNPAQDVWCRVETYPGQSQNVITNQSGGTALSGKVRFVNVQFQPPTSYMISAQAWTWFDSGCLFTGGGSAPLLYRGTNVFLTHSTVQNLSAEGLSPYSGSATFWCLVRGNILETNASIMPGVVIGNLHDITANKTFQIKQEISGSTAPFPDLPIIAFNRFMGLNNASVSALNLAINTNLTGGVVAQNLFEWSGSASQSVLGIANDSSTAQATNLIIWNNTIAGNRINLSYNEVGSSPLYRSMFSVLNNSLDDDNIKSDTFVTQNGARIGNWAELFGVGHAGNFGGTVGDISTSSFSHGVDGGFYGLNSYEQASYLPANYQQYVNFAANATNGAGAGLGNYRLKSASPLNRPSDGYQSKWVLPYDIEGVPRGGFDPPGAYASACPRKGAGFFQ